MRFPLESTAVQWVWDSQQALFSNIDFFGATPSELVGSVFSFVFSDGFASDSALDADLTASSSLPTNLPGFVGDPPAGGPVLPPGTVTDDPDPAVVAAPAPLPIFGAISAFHYARKLRRRTQTNPA